MDRVGADVWSHMNHETDNEEEEDEEDDGVYTNFAFLKLFRRHKF